MKVLHVIDSYVLSEDILTKDTYRVGKGLQDYKRFLNIIKFNRPELVHIHEVNAETFGMYALLARINKVKVVRTIHTLLSISNWYTVKQLAARFFFNHTIVTSKYDLMNIDKFHIASKGKRTLIYKGVDKKKDVDYLKKDASRLHIYKELGISFTKNIRIIGTIMMNDADNGIEHLIDAAYLADKYKNLTNTVFMILCQGKVSTQVRDQIAELHVGGICLVIENFEHPEEYIKAFDIFISPRSKSGDFNLLLLCSYLHVPMIATKVGDAKEFELEVAAPLVPPQSAKFLTEAIMFVIKNEVPTSKTITKKHPISKKFTAENEFIVTHEIYNKMAQKRHIKIV